MSGLRILLIVSCLALLGLSKVISDTQSVSAFNKKSWTYMAKFAVATGEGRFVTKVQLTKKVDAESAEKHIKLKGAIYIDDDWDNVQSIDDCNEKLKFAKSVFDVFVPKDGSWSQESPVSVSQKARTRVWFLTLTDCDHELTRFYSAANRIKWEVTALNSDGSHFSEEENGVLTYIIITMGIILSFFMANTVKFYRFWKTEDTFDYASLILICILACEFFALLCETLHLWSFSYNGKGFFIFDFGNLALSVLSQFVLTCLLMLIAYGWSIRFNEFEDMDVFIPIGILLAILHVMIVGIGTITNNEHYRYHDYENWAGIVILVLRVLFFMFWAYLFKGTYETSAGDEETFYKRFGILSTIYFLAFPILVIISSVFVAPYVRHKVITLGTLIIQTTIQVILTFMFTNKKSKYYNVSLKGRTLVMSGKLD
jgi:Rhodopsin-like GPCR transmembrane domain